MRLEATAALLGLRDLGGKLTTRSRAMVGHAEAICQMLFGYVVAFVSQPFRSRQPAWQVLSCCKGG